MFVHKCGLCWEAGRGGEGERVDLVCVFLCVSGVSCAVSVWGFRTRTQMSRGSKRNKLV